MTKKQPYELAFVGGASRYAESILGDYARNYPTLEEAEEAAGELLERFDADGTRAAHPAIIYGPDFGPDGWTVR